ncbi:hypothetical protein CerSpe_274740 [Prunus speciosa]
MGMLHFPLSPRVLALLYHDIFISYKFLSSSPTKKSGSDSISFPLVNLRSNYSLSDLPLDRVKRKVFLALEIIQLDQPHWII